MLTNMNEISHSTHTNTASICGGERCKFMLKRIKSIFTHRKNENRYENQNIEKLKKFKLGNDLDDNISQLLRFMGNCFDIKTRKLTLSKQNVKVAVVYIDNLADSNIVLEHIIKPLTINSSDAESNANNNLFEHIKNSVISAGTAEETESYDDIVLAVMSGNTFVCIEGYSKGIIINSKGYSGRSVTEPIMEPSVKGPKEGFVELLKDNLSIIRRRIRDPNLSLEKHIVGRRTKGEVVIAYMRGIVNPELVNEIRKRIQAVDIDDHVTTAKLLHFIVDHPKSIFPQVQTTERPDKVVSALLSGQIGIIIEGSPTVLITPVTLPMLLQSADDYHENTYIVSLIRFSRYVCLIISALFPSIYIAITSFHPGILPTTLALSIAGARAGVPFPAFLEAVAMEVTLEILEEAGKRLPKVIGQTVSIVGGLVIGQSAVQAKIVSPIMVIVIAFTAIASFTIPDYSLNLASRILRIPFMILATTLGAFGISIGVLYILGYLCSLENLGMSYMEPITPYRLRDWKDTIIRAPYSTFGKRPEFLAPEDSQQQIITKIKKAKNKGGP